MNLTSADYFTFNVDNSLLLIGQTGSGKSYLVHELVKRYERAYTPEEMKYAFFDLKQSEFGVSWGTVKQDYLLFDVEYSGDEKTFQRLEELADLAELRVAEGIEQPFIFIYIEECDLIMLDAKRFDKAFIKIAKNAKEANIKIIFSTSRPSPDVLSEELKNTFDLILAGPLVPDDYSTIGIEKPVNLSKYQFSVTAQNDRSRQ